MVKGKGCKWVLVKGPRAGEICGKELPKEMAVEQKYQGYCYTHMHRLEEEDRWQKEQLEQERNQIVKKMEEDNKTVLRERFAFNGPSSTGVLLLEGILRDVLSQLKKGQEIDFDLHVIVMNR